jgi:F-type H+-transporting ATPase subunit delta
MVSEQSSISKGIATRYAAALFGLAEEQGDLETLSINVEALMQCLKDSDDFNTLIASPMYTRDEQENAITEIAKKMGLSGIVTNTLSLMASKRRLFVLPTLLAVLNELISASKNEVTAEVVTAQSLSKSQITKLEKSLKANFGKDVRINESVDQSLIGGMIVKVGSRMIDTTIKAKLNSLQNVMKEVG